MRENRMHAIKACNTIKTYDVNHLYHNRDLVSQILSRYRYRCSRDSLRFDASNHSKSVVRSHQISKNSWNALENRL
jgi:hypothetical protein